MIFSKEKNEYFGFFSISHFEEITHTKKNCWYKILRLIKSINQIYITSKYQNQMES
jgi:hypothetical protein